MSKGDGWKELDEMTSRDQLIARITNLREAAAMVEQGAEKFASKQNRLRKLSFADVRERLQEARSEAVRARLVGELDRRYKKLWRLRMKG